MKPPDEEYVNDACPAECSTEHDVPHSGMFECPETDDMFVWCSECGDWFAAEPCVNQEITVRTRNGRGTESMYLCDPEAHSYVICQDCEIWILESEASAPCYRCDEHYCYRCWQGCDCPACDPEPDYDYDRGGYDEDETDEAEEIIFCSRCGHGNVFLDLLSEEFFCKCAMDALLENDSAHPFLQGASV